MRALFVTADDYRSNRGGYGIYSRQLVDELSSHFCAESVRLDGQRQQEFVGSSVVHRFRQLVGAGDYDGNSRREMARRRDRLEAFLGDGAVSITFVNHLRAAGVPRIPGERVRVFIAHNAESRAARRPLLARRRRQLESLERSAVGAADVVVGLTQEDLRSLGAESKGVLIPPRVDDLVRLRGDSVITGPPSVIYSGTFHWHEKRANARWLIDTIMKRVWEKRPDIVLHIVGSGSDRLKNVDPRVNRLGFDEAATLWSSANVVVAPELQPGGLKLKVLEAAGSGFPLVATPCAVEGTGLRDGAHLWVRPSSDGIASALLEAIGDASEAHARAASAQRAVWETFGASRFSQRVASLAASVRSYL